MLAAAAAAAAAALLGRRRRRRAAVELDRLPQRLLKSVVALAGPGLERGQRGVAAGRLQQPGKEEAQAAIGRGLAARGAGHDVALQVGGQRGRGLAGLGHTHLPAGTALVGGGEDLAVGHQDVDLFQLLRVVEPAQQADALHMLRFFKRVGHEVGAHDAEAQVDAVAHQAAHLFVDRDRRTRCHRQITRGRQFDDAAADQHTVGRLQQQRAPCRAGALDGAGQQGAAHGHGIDIQRRCIAHREASAAGLVLQIELREDVADFDHRLAQVGAGVVVGAGHTCPGVAQLALELQHLGQEDVPGPHHHAPLPIAPGRAVDALAPRRPGVEEDGVAAGARQHRQRQEVAALWCRAAAPQVGQQAGAGDQRFDLARFVGVPGRGHTRAQMQRRHRLGLGLGQWAGQLQRQRAQHHAFEAQRPFGAGGAHTFAGLAEHVLLAAQRLGVAQPQHVEAGAGDHRRHGGDGRAFAQREDRRALGAAGQHDAVAAAAAQQFFDLHRGVHRQVQHAAFGVDGQAGTELDLVAGQQLQVEAVHDAAAAGAGGQLLQAAVVLLLALQVRGTQELAVEVVQPRERGGLGDQRDAGGLLKQHDGIGAVAKVVDREGHEWSPGIGWVQARAASSAPPRACRVAVGSSTLRTWLSTFAAVSV